MKQIFTILTIFFAANCFATHLMGGEIVAKQTGVLTYNVSMSLYRDGAGINMDTDQQFHVFNAQNQFIGTYDFNYQGAASGSQMPGFPYDIEPYFYEREITFPTAGRYTIMFSHCCRNEAILNLSAPLEERMVLKTEITVYQNQHNSSPEFLAPPVAYLPVMFPWEYNPMPYDADGDSLVWSIVTVEGESVEMPANVSRPCWGWSLPASTVNNVFTINQQSGVISWTAGMLGNFVSAVLVEEYRNGVKIGEIRRDMQFVVVPQENNGVPLFLEGSFQLFTQNKFGNLETNITPEGGIDFLLKGENPDYQVEELTILGYGEPFLQDSNVAELTVVNNSSNKQTVRFSWTPNESQIRQRPYIVMFRIGDGTWSYDKTVLIGVRENPIPVVVGGNDLMVYPNPSSTNFMTYFPSTEKGNYSLSVYDLSGKCVIRTSSQLSYNNLLEINHELTSGVYLITIETPEEVFTDKLVVE